MPLTPVASTLSPQLQQLQSGIPKIFTAPGSKVDAAKVTTILSPGVLAGENLANNAALVALSQQVPAQLNTAKALMNSLGVADITKAPAMVVDSTKLSSATLRAMPGQMKITGGLPSYTPGPGLVNQSVIIASSLDLTNTSLVVGPSVSNLTIIVQTLTCGANAVISFDDSSVWPPAPAAQTTAQPGIGYNTSGTYTDPATGNTSVNGPSGGAGAAGAPGSAQTAVPLAAPSVSIYALNITGMPTVKVQGLKGATGNPGQNGGAGGNGAAGENGSDFATFGVGACLRSPGDGGNGGNGGNGGSGGNGGVGGAGGSFFIATTAANWTALINKSLTWTLANTGGPGGDQAHSEAAELPVCRAVAATRRRAVPATTLPARRVRMASTGGKAPWARRGIQAGMDRRGATAR